MCHQVRGEGQEDSTPQLGRKEPQIQEFIHSRESGLESMHGRGSRGRGRSRGGGRRAGRFDGGGFSLGYQQSPYPQYQPQYQNYGKGFGKKQHARNIQLHSLEQKANEEEEYFYHCVEMFKKTEHSGLHHHPDKRLTVEQVFGSGTVGGSGGIKFDQYEVIPVQRSGPDADQVPAMENFLKLKDALPPFLVQNIDRMKYSRPTPIQKHAIPLILAGRDVLCAAQTGSGKTFAFLLPVIASFGRTPQHESTADPSLRTPARPRGLVLAPTRELASQIKLEAMKLTFGHSTTCVVIYGGANAKGQLEELAGGVDLLIATPGRLTDFLDRSLVFLGDCTNLILDEADRMLDMGFKPQIERIMSSGLPPTEARRTFMFSATFPPEIQKLGETYMREYVYVAVGRVGSTTENIEQRFCLVENTSKSGKVELLRSTLEKHQPVKSTIVFVQRKRTATSLCKTLRYTFGIHVVEIHGDRSQAQREAALADFRAGNAQVSKAIIIDLILHSHTHGHIQILTSMLLIFKYK